MSEMNEVAAPERSKPCIHLQVEDLPELKNAKLGQIFNLTVKAKVKSLNQDTYDKKQSVSATLEVQSMNDKSFKDKSYKDIMEEDSEIEGDE